MRPVEGSFHPGKLVRDRGEVRDYHGPEGRGVENPELKPGSVGLSDLSLRYVLLCVSVAN